MSSYYIYSLTKETRSKRLNFPKCEFSAALVLIDHVAFHYLFQLRSEFCSCKFLYGNTRRWSLSVRFDQLGNQTSDLSLFSRH